MSTNDQTKPSLADRGAPGTSKRPEAVTDNRSMGELVVDVSEKTSYLIREEIELAKAEVTEKVSTLVKGGVVGIAAGVFLLLFLAMLVHHVLQVFKYGPKIAAKTNQAAITADSWPEALRADWQKWFMLLKINATIGPIATLLGMALVRR